MTTEIIELNKNEINQSDIEIHEKLQFSQQIKDLFSKGIREALYKPKNQVETIKQIDFHLNKYRSKRSFFRRLKSPLTYVGFILVFIVLTWAFHAHWLSPFTYQEITSLDMSRHAFAPPDDYHPLGSAQFGQDVLGRLIFGSRTSLQLSIEMMAITIVFGILFGVIAAYYGGIVDNIIMRIADVMMSFPSLILTILIFAIFRGPNSINVLIITWGLLGVPGYARLMRGSVLQERSKTYVEAAKVSGASNWKIMFKHILPNAVAPILISATSDIGGTILGLAGIGFLGLSSFEIEWGLDISLNKAKLMNAPWAAIWPGVGILITVLGFMLLGDGLRDAFDPRSKA